MAYKKSIIILICAFFISLSINTRIFAETAYAEPPPCPSKDNILSEIEKRNNNLLKIETGIRELMEGKSGGNVSPTAFFTVDLDDNSAIARRIDELKKLQETLKEPDSRHGYDYLIKCAAGNENAEIKAKELSDLYYSIDSLRLEFLSLPEEKRKKLLDTKTESNNQSEQIKALNNEKEEALNQKDEAKKSLQEAEQKALNETNKLSRDIASERAILEKVKSDLSDVQAKSASETEKQTRIYQDTAEKLTEIDNSLTSELSQESLKTIYKATMEIWRMLVDSAFKNSGTSFYTFKTSNFPDLPSYPSDLLEKSGRREDAENYIQSYNETKNLRNDLLLKGKQRLEENMALHYRLMIKAGKIRSRLFNILKDAGYISIDKILTEDHIKDLFREIKVVPYRWAAIFYVKAVDIRHNLMSGIKGWIQIAENIIFFIFFLMIPFLFWLLMKKITTYINSIKDVRWDLSLEDSHSASLNMALKNASPYIPWVGTIIAVSIASNIIEITVFAELEIFLPYISFYCYYRIFRLFFSSSFSKAIFRSKLRATSENKEKIEETVKLTGLVFFISLSILHATESMISRGIIYWLALRIIFISSVLVIIWVIARWKKELAETIRNNHKNPVLGLIASGIEGKFSLMWTAPAVIVFSFLIIIYWLRVLSERFETYKILSATIFRKKLENLTKENGASKKDLPAEYTDMFTFEVPDDTDILMSPKDDLLSELTESVEKWIKGSSDGHSVAIYGDKGSGKSCLLWRLANLIQGVKIIRVSVPPRMTDRKSVFDFFGKYIGAEILDGAACLKKHDKEIGKTLFLIDETHNLFLGKVGGFDGFNAFLEMVNAETANIYWCMAFNRYAWIYLYSVFGNRPYINEVKKMPSWTDKDIKSMIETRHSKTDFRISYNKIITAAGNNDRFESVAQAEANFFRLIWQQSGGNPRISIHLWLSALKHKPPYLLEAGLPEKYDISVISKLPEDALFIYAEILKHENLTLEETTLSSNLPFGVVNHALRLGIQNKFLEKSSDGRYRIAVLFQNTLINYLTGRNFIYEQ